MSIKNGAIVALICCTNAHRLEHKGAIK